MDYTEQKEEKPSSLDMFYLRTIFPERSVNRIQHQDKFYKEFLPKRIKGCIKSQYDIQLNQKTLKSIFDEYSFFVTSQTNGVYANEDSLIITEFDLLGLFDRELFVVYASDIDKSVMHLCDVLDAYYPTRFTKDEIKGLFNGHENDDGFLIDLWGNLSSNIFIIYIKKKDIVHHTEQTSNIINTITGCLSDIIETFNSYSFLNEDFKGLFSSKLLFKIWRQITSYEVSDRKYIIKQLIDKENPVKTFIER